MITKFNYSGIIEITYVYSIKSVSNIVFSRVVICSRNWIAAVNRVSWTYIMSPRDRSSSRISFRYQTGNDSSSQRTKSQSDAPCNFWTNCTSNAGEGTTSFGKFSSCTVFPSSFVEDVFADRVFV